MNLKELTEIVSDLIEVPLNLSDLHTLLKDFRKKYAGRSIDDILLHLHKNAKKLEQKNLQNQKNKPVSDNTLNPSNLRSDNSEINTKKVDNDVKEFQVDTENDEKKILPIIHEKPITVKYMRQIESVKAQIEILCDQEFEVFEPISYAKKRNKEVMVKVLLEDYTCIHICMDLDIPDEPDVIGYEFGKRLRDPLKYLKMN